MTAYRAPARRMYPDAAASLDIAAGDRDAHGVTAVDAGNQPRHFFPTPYQAAAATRGLPPRYRDVAAMRAIGTTMHDAFLVLGYSAARMHADKRARIAYLLEAYSSAMPRAIEWLDEVRVKPAVRDVVLGGAGRLLDKQYEETTGVSRARLIQRRYAVKKSLPVELRAVMERMRE